MQLFAVFCIDYFSVLLGGIDYQEIMIIEVLNYFLKEELNVKEIGPSWFYDEI